jgi:uncharacterized membrane protein (UPF0127 family)
MGGEQAMNRLEIEDMRESLRFELATGLLSRARGLLDPIVCRKGEVLVLAPCARIHTFGMQEAIDVAFVNRQGRVLKAQRGLLPNRFLACRDAVCVLERRSGGFGTWFDPGEVIRLSACSPEG